MRGGVRTYIYCQPPAGGRIRSQGNKMRIMNGRRDGFINIKDMYNNDVGRGRVRGYEAYEVK
jgi:hypothetical protein